MLYANGDSWTFGDEFPLQYPMTEVNRYYQTWPWQLAQNLDIPMVVNDGLSAGNNTRIFRRTCDFIFSWLGKNRSAKDLVIVVGWTTPERTEVFAEDRHCRITVNQLIDNKHNQDLRDYQQIYYRLYNDKQGLLNQVRQMLTLRQISKNLGIYYYDFIALGDDPDVYQKLAIDNYGLQLDGLLYSLSWQHSTADKKWTTFLHGHPTEQTHKIWADILASLIK